MSKVVIADSSCLIALSKIGKLSILRQLFGEVLIPSAVYDEVVVRGAGRPGADEVQTANWIQVSPVADALSVKTLRLTLGAGESEAIALAYAQSAELIILDDWKSRQVALALSLPVVGTVAILQKAVEKGYIAELPPILEALRAAGFRFSF